MLIIAKWETVRERDRQKRGSQHRRESPSVKENRASNTKREIVRVKKSQQKLKRVSKS